MDHLLQSICEVALLPVEQRIAKLRSEYWIGYTRAQEALDKMEGAPRSVNKLVVERTTLEVMT